MPYLVFDVETIPDGDLISCAKYPTRGFSAKQAIDEAHAEALRESDGKSDFISLTYHIPIVLAAFELDDKFVLTRTITLANDDRNIATEFWGHAGKRDTVLVSFNGRCFDLPVLELAAFKHGIKLPGTYLGKYGGRNRYGDNHIDLMDYLNNYGAVRLSGGLNALSLMLGRNGKASGEMTGGDVHRMFMAGELDKIVSYCFNDVLETYAVFLRTRVMIGQLTDVDETRLLVAARRR